MRLSLRIHMGFLYCLPGAGRLLLDASPEFLDLGMNPHLGPALAASSGLWAQSGGGLGVLVTGKAVWRFLTCCAPWHLVPTPSSPQHSLLEYGPLHGAGTWLYASALLLRAMQPTASGHGWRSVRAPAEMALCSQNGDPLF